MSGTCNAYMALLLCKIMLLFLKTPFMHCKKLNFRLTRNFRNRNISNSFQRLDAEISLIQPHGPSKMKYRYLFNNSLCLATSKDSDTVL
jgi:hypothetical protein